MNTETENKLSGHIKTAVNAIQKEIDRKRTQADKLYNKSLSLQKESSVLIDEIAGLEEQITKLKGQ